MKSRYLVIIIIALSLILSAWVFVAKRVCFTEKSAFLMNTPVRVKVAGADPEIALQEIRRLDHLFNRFAPQSEISRLNQGQKFQPSSDTQKCLALAKQMKKITGGAFDARYKNGHDLDLGGIAKGYAVEQARKLLLKSGAKSGIIDLRSSIVVFGPRTWRIGIQHPREKEQLLGVVELADGQALSTSGDYERGRHIVDPKTGRPADQCEAVTLLGKNAAELDALSTAVFVLGPKRGIKLIDKLEGIDGLIVDSKGKLINTEGFPLEKYDYNPHPR